jgi:hypothetical protein
MAQPNSALYAPTTGRITVKRLIIAVDLHTE